MLSVIFLVALFGGSLALDCVQIPDSAIIPRSYTTVPTGANSTVEIPPNWSCTYNVRVPEMVYAQVRLENGLRGNNDLITVVDAQGTRTLVSSRSTPVVTFYIFPNTTTTFKVVTKSVNMQSSFRLVVFYNPMLAAGITHLGTSSIQYWELNQLQVSVYYHPRTIQATERISMQLARSDSSYDVYDNFFVIEGNLENSTNVYRLSKFAYSDYISDGNQLTVLGLDNRVLQSSLVFMPLSQVQQYDSFTSFSVFYDKHTLEIDATSGPLKKKAVNVISMKDITQVLSFNMPDRSCSLKAVETPPSPTSEVLVDFSTITSSRFNITRKSFAIVSENCKGSFSLYAANY